MPTLKERLDRVAQKGMLSTSDLATWFGLPYQTLRFYRLGVEPYSARRAYVEQRLGWLENAVQRKNWKLPPSQPLRRDELNRRVGEYQRR